MPRKREGSAFRHGDHYDVRITFPDGKQSNKQCLPTGTSYAAAKEKALYLTQQAAKEGYVRVYREPPPTQGTTLAVWGERWFTDRTARGMTSVRADTGRFRKWVLPMLGAKPMASIDRRDVERLVESLDASVRAGGLSWKTAQNVWGLVTKGFDDACSSKTLALRVLEGRPNPCDNVRGPDKGVRKSKAYLYPAEFSHLMACEKVPASARVLYIVTTYLYLRAAEARGLQWSDIDLEHGMVLVHQTENTEGVRGSTKGERSRRYSIEAALMPLLRAMHKRAGGVGPVLPGMPIEQKVAPMLRRHLLAAGITRAELHATDKTRKRLRFHDLKATSITWAAVRGDDPLKIKHRAAHRTFSTTEEYIRTAEAVREGFGDVFPAPPAELVSSWESSSDTPAASQPFVIAYQKSRAEGGSRTPVDRVAEALASALKAATEAGEWATVANLAEQLRQRQPTAPRAAIVDLRRERERRALRGARPPVRAAGGRGREPMAEARKVPMG